MVPGVLLEPYMSQGGQDVAETPIVSTGLKVARFVCISVFLTRKEENSSLHKL